jgi:hypothetical protein
MHGDVNIQSRTRTPTYVMYVEKGRAGRHYVNSMGLVGRR